MKIKATTPCYKFMDATPEDIDKLNTNKSEPF